MSKPLTIGISVVIAAVLFALIWWGTTTFTNRGDTNRDTTNIENTMSDTRTVVFTTNKGDITLEFLTRDVPNTTGNFIKLAEEGFYDDTRFHRVIDGFMIQGGDPLSRDESMQARWGTGGPGYTFEDEFVDGLSNVRGTISMANAGPNTNGSQFFINVADNTFLDGKHSVFGRVIEGMDIVDAISKVATEGPDRPLDDVILESIKFE